MGRGGAENLLAAGGPEVPGLQGRALRAWPVLPTFVQAASEVTPQPPPLLVVVASVWGGTVWRGTWCPTPPLANGTSRSMASAQGCLRARLPRQQGGVAWGLACVRGT